ncbi:MAG: hypothetical protein JO021_00290, partial [Alphaproteobacteria bacterium]|nr:hypothetical protein [Alphaproteobacteria bacterium]
MTDAPVRAIDAVVNIWTEEVIQLRPSWRDQFFEGKMKAKRETISGMSLEAMIARMDA